MSDFGTFLVDRGVFSHAAFTAQPFTEIQAWLWLIASASNRPRDLRKNHTVVHLERGQLCYSHRFIAKRWDWTVARVQRFLSRLVTELMITTLTHESAASQVVTICNYDKFQVFCGAPEVPNESGPSQIKDSKLTSIESNGVDVGSARAREENYITAEAFQLADEIMITLAIDKNFVPPGWCGVPMWLQAGLNSGWRPELVRIAAAKIRARRNFQPPYSFKYLARPIQREHELAAEPHLPMPPVIAAQNTEVAHAQTAPVAGDWKQSRDDFRGARARLKAGLAQSTGEDSGSSSGSVVRLAAPAGRGQS